MEKEKDLKQAMQLAQKILSEKKKLLLGELNETIKLLEKHELKEGVNICYKIANAEAKVADYANEIIQPLFFELKKIIIDELKKEK